ncbi:9238_t:CDS:2 [Ambispora gerdemannii]|uniref:9238_t:CDS:1 n=1 Tax=Ambispora gerdemannii TaxID=144530 RepID=A0A9N8VAG9_9GLOM|nr:9238_t:CDS:2 [Ambispora gerdemannii]
MSGNRFTALTVTPPAAPHNYQGEDSDNETRSNDIERPLLFSFSPPPASPTLSPQLSPTRPSHKWSISNLQNQIESTPQVRYIKNMISIYIPRHKLRPYFRGACRRLFSFILILIVLFTALTFVKYKAVPSLYTYDDIKFSWKPIEPLSYLKPINETFGEITLLLDGHAHTTESDGAMKPEMLLKWAIANGYSAIIVSDHNTIKGGLLAQQIAHDKFNDSIVVIPAMEYSSCRIHMNLIGINESIPFGPPSPSDEDLQKVIRHTHELGGLVSVNHIPWSNSTENWYQEGTLPNHPSREQLLEWGVDAFEIINGDTFDWVTYNFAQNHNLLMLTGSDVHSPSDGAYAWTTISTKDRSMAGIMSELREKRTSFLFDATGTRPRAYPKFNPAYYKMLPITLLADYWTSFYTETRGMYSFQDTFCHPRQFTMHTITLLARPIVKWARKVWLIWRTRLGLTPREQNDLGLVGMGASP